MSGGNEVDFVSEFVKAAGNIIPDASAEQLRRLESWVRGKYHGEAIYIAKKTRKMTHEDNELKREEANRLLAERGGNKVEVAKEMGIARSKLYRLIGRG